MAKGIQIYEDPADRSTYSNGLEEENERLRHRVDALERQLNSQSPSRPSKKSGQMITPHKPLSNGGDDFGTTLFKLNAMNLSPKEPKMSPARKTPGKKIRQLTTRKWDFMDENELDSYT
ncbi:MAG: hypothetical protein Q9183_006681 [Haloplaca sp. 2 TL-2023]